MAPPKRKSPEKKNVRKQGPSLASRMLDRAVSAIARHPRLLGGAAAFGVVFSFVAANALWYQPKHHPAPLLATRMFENEALKKAKAAPDAVEQASTDAGVTTFRIERQADLPLKARPVEAAKPVASPLVKQIQQALAARGLYDGPTDGLTGPRTTSAILFFQETEGLEQTGDVSQALLAKIKSQNTAVAVIPDERPSPDVTASTKKTSTKNSDDVANLILAAEAKPVADARSTKPEASEPALSADKVMKIQKALAKFAYADVKVDGVAGAATRAAIRAFEKNYNLPVTGEPSERVLRKLKSIGAL
jgi:peptidoglycan hydrolase-like protein with peptidoglycan-binding domain